MDKQEARGLASWIRREPGWHAEVNQNHFTGSFYVMAWTDEMQDGGDDGEPGDWYMFHYAVEWYRTRAALAQEACGEAEWQQPMQPAVKDVLPF